MAYGVKISQKKFFDSTAITTSLYCPACPKYLAEIILPLPTLCECRECAEYAPRSVQMHTGAYSATLPTLPRPCLCFWTLPYSEYIYYIIAYKKSQAPERSQCLTRDLRMIHLKGRCFMPPSAGLSKLLIISSPWQGVEPSRALTVLFAHACGLFSFVFRGDKSRPTVDCQSSTRGRGREDYQALSYLQFHSLI